MDSCSYDSLFENLGAKLSADSACNHDALTELQFIFDVDSEELVKERLAEACAAGQLPFSAITDEGSVFDKEYYDGGTYYNEQRESINVHGITTNKLANNPGSRIRNIHDTIAQSRGITFPDYVDNFESCDLSSVLCCFVQDRQANDNNGNCDDPYNEECVDANPGDNTDICYVDMSRSPSSSRTSSGFALFEEEDEDASHCHGIAWAEDPTDPSARFKGNNLFFVSLYDHFTQRGYVRNVPGAPMCACAEKVRKVVEQMACVCQ